MDLMYLMYYIKIVLKIAFQLQLSSPAAQLVHACEGFL